MADLPYRPKGFTSLTPHLVVRALPDAIAFYIQAFDAEEVVRMHGPDGSPIYSEVRIDGSILALGEEMQGMQGWMSPQSLEGTTVALTLYVEDAGATYQRALDAGAETVLPLHDAFWGDRMARVRDPFGHEWAICTQVEEHAPEELDDRAKAFFEQMAKQQAQAGSGE